MIIKKLNSLLITDILDLLENGEITDTKKQQVVDESKAEMKKKHQERMEEKKAKRKAKLSKFFVFFNSLEDSQKQKVISIIKSN